MLTRYDVSEYDGRIRKGMNKCLSFKWLMLETRNGSLLLDRNHRWLTPPPLHPTYHTALPLSFPLMPSSFTYRANFFCLSLPFSSLRTSSFSSHFFLFLSHLIPSSSHLFLSHACLFFCFYLVTPHPCLFPPYSP
jgi:hypothetical protein